MPGTSLIAVAMPMPTPTKRLPRGSNTSRSTRTNAHSTKLIWPNVNASRIGSNPVNSRNAAETRNQRGSPRRSANGATNQ